MEPLNSRRDKAPSRHPMPLSKTSRAGNGLYCMAPSTKGPHGHPQTLQVLAKANGYSSHLDGKSPLLKTVHIVKDEKSSWYLTSSVLSTSYRHWKVLLKTASYKPHNLWRACKIYGCYGGTMVWEVTNHFLIGFHAHAARHC